MTYEEAWKELKNKVHEKREENIRNADLHAEAKSYAWFQKLIDEVDGINIVVNLMNNIEFHIDKIDENYQKGN